MCNHSAKVVPEWGLEVNTFDDDYKVLDAYISKMVCDPCLIFGIHRSLEHWLLTDATLTLDMARRVRLKVNIYDDIDMKVFICSFLNAYISKTCKVPASYSVWFFHRALAFHACSHALRVGPEVII